MIRIITLQMTCGSCPSQWEGVSDDGRHVYIRYRWGYLSAGVGKDIHEAIDTDVWSRQVGDPLHGTMGGEVMAVHLAGVFDFSDAAGDWR